jgi:hypothetical protein
MVPMLLGQLIVVPVSQTLVILERQHIQFGWDLTRLVVVGGAISATAFVTGSDYATVAAFAVSMTIMYLILLALIHRELSIRIRTRTSTV